MKEQPARGAGDDGFRPKSYSAAFSNCGSAATDDRSFQTTATPLESFYWEKKGWSVPRQTRCSRRCVLESETETNQRNGGTQIRYFGRIFHFRTASRQKVTWRTRRHSQQRRRRYTKNSQACIRTKRWQGLDASDRTRRKRVAECYLLRRRAARPGGEERLVKMPVQRTRRNVINKVSFHDSTGSRDIQVYPLASVLKRRDICENVISNVVWL